MNLTIRLLIIIGVVSLLNYAIVARPISLSPVLSSNFNYYRYLPFPGWSSGILINTEKSKRWVSSSGVIFINRGNSLTHHVTSRTQKAAASGGHLQASKTNYSVSQLTIPLTCIYKLKSFNPYYIYTRIGIECVFNLREKFWGKLYASDENWNFIPEPIYYSRKTDFKENNFKPDYLGLSAAFGSTVYINKNVGSFVEVTISKLFRLEAYVDAPNLTISSTVGLLYFI
ncbi:MAG: hypothetical protein COC01_03630 [Bacteroidetes bacterium]|nr:hypothetical protein [Bacteroidia bacterium]PCH68523.1 MAG: hypothetical protein COC01_03630 [Bacteroidota bacterium]